MKHSKGLILLALLPIIFGEESHSAYTGGHSPSLWEVISGNTASVTKGNAAPHIVGGNIAVPHSYPYQVRLDIKSKDGTKSTCGGSLISPNWILTAAHCVTDTVTVVATLGAHNLRDAENSRQVIQVVKVITHEDYFVSDNDIALLKLIFPATLNQYVKTVQLPSLSLRGKDLSGRSVVLVGWGRYKDSIPSPSTDLRSVETRIISNVDCLNIIGFAIKDMQICTDGRNGKGACTGDSGGPLIVRDSNGRDTLIGVLSSGHSVCEGGMPTVSNRVDRFLAWILRKTSLAV